MEIVETRYFQIWVNFGGMFVYTNYENAFIELDS